MYTAKIYEHVKYRSFIYDCYISIHTFRFFPSKFTSHITYIRKITKKLYQITI